MTESTATAAGLSGPAPAPARRGRRVVDAPTRMFHWLFALAFAGAWLTGDADAWRALHVTLGYTMVGLLVFRVGYALLGPRHARLGAPWRRLAGARAWLGEVVGRGARAGGHWRQGQNLLMAAVAAALLAAIAPLALSGYATYAQWGGEWLEEVHEFFAHLALALVSLHLGLLALLSVVWRRNQALAMLTGRVDGAGPDLVRADRRWLAALLLLAVIAFGAWQWQQSPHGLLPSAAALRAGGAWHDDD